MHPKPFPKRLLLLLRLIVAASSPALYAGIVHADARPERQLPILVSGLRQQQASAREANEYEAQAQPKRRAAALQRPPKPDSATPDSAGRALERLSGHCWRAEGDGMERCFLFDAEAQALTKYGCHRGQLLELRHYFAGSENDHFELDASDASIHFRQRTFTPIWPGGGSPLYDQSRYHHITAQGFIAELRTWQDQSMPFEDRTRQTYHHTRALDPAAAVCDPAKRSAAAEASRAKLAATSN